MESVVDNDIETMSMTSGVSEAPVEAEKYDLQFDLNEEQKILSKIKGLNLNLKLTEFLILYILNDIVNIF